MNHCCTVRLEMDRLILRRFQMTDAPDFFRNVTSDPRVSRFLTWQNHESLTQNRRTDGKLYQPL